jgi:hypothetical protein
MSKTYIIRTLLTAHEDYEVEARSPEEAYEMYKSGDYLTNGIHLETDVLYGSENKFHGIWQLGEHGEWIGERNSDDPLVKANDYVHPYDWNKGDSDE